jgi:hypothetical protein
MTLKGKYKLTFDDFNDKIMTKLNLRDDIEKNTTNKITSTLYHLLTFDPNIRLTIDECVDCFYSL